METRTPRERLIVALDFPSARSALALTETLDGTVGWFKVGLELYLAAGPGIVAELRSRGYAVFLDLKLHDIPNTVAAAVRTLSDCGAALLTIHASGGPAMLTAAVRAAQECISGPKLLAVTVLTSMNAQQLHAAGVAGSPADQVTRLANLAHEAGVPGLVCSAEEVRMLRKRIGPNTMLVVPGIRPMGIQSGDQQRVATPGDAIGAGASMLVVGRPITQSPEPRRAAEVILAEMERGA